MAIVDSLRAADEELRERKRTQILQQQSEASSLNAYTAALRERRETAQAEMEFELKKGKAELEKKEFDYKIGKDLLTALSIKQLEDPEKLSFFYETDSGKSLVKEIKQRLGPSFIDDKGRPLLLEKPEVKDSIELKLLRDEPLSQGEIKFLVLTQPQPQNFLKQVTDAAKYELEATTSPEEQMLVFQKYMKEALSGVTSVANALKEQDTEAASEPSLEDFLGQFRRK